MCRKYFFLLWVVCDCLLMGVCVLCLLVCVCLIMYACVMTSLPIVICALLKSQCLPPSRLLSYVHRYSHMSSNLMCSCVCPLVVSSFSFEGSMDEVRFWNRARMHEEILSTMYRPLFKSGRHISIMMFCLIWVFFLALHMVKALARTLCCTLGRATPCVRMAFCLSCW